MAQAIDVGLKKLEVVAVEWKIERDVIRLPLTTPDIRFTSSPHFTAFNYKWRIDIYPHGYNVANSSFVSLFLTNVDEEILPSTSVVISLMLGKTVEIAWKPSKVIKCKKFFATKPSKLIGSTTFVTRFLLLDYLQSTSKELKVICHISSLGGHIKEPVANRAVEHFKELYLKQEMCDVSIKVGAKTYPAHKVILSARSPVFRSMFTHDTDESKNGVVEIDDCHGDSFEAFLRYIYTGDDGYVNSSNAPYLFKTADKYLMDDLRKVSRTRIKMDANTFCDVLDLADTYNDVELLEQATQFYVKNWETILNSEKWKNLFIEKPLVAYNFIRKTLHMCTLNLK